MLKNFAVALRQCIFGDIANDEIGFSIHHAVLANFELPQNICWRISFSAKKKL